MNSQRTITRWNLAPLLLASAALALLVVSVAAKAQTPQKTEPLIFSIKGPDLFRAYCAVCHGVAGQGDGPMAPELKAKTPDLTILARKNNGRFPAARVRKAIDGTEIVRSHGPREMPVWGPIFHQIEDDKDFGNVRLENLVKYLESLQQK